MRALVTTLCLVAGLLPLHARADEYESRIDEGVREFGAGNFVEARALFEQAHALSPNARTLRALGICAFELKHYVQATEELSAALIDTRNPLTPDLAAAVNETLAKARRFVGELVLETKPPASRVSIDGVTREGRSYALDVGDHLVAASADGHRSRDLTVTIGGMQTRRVELVLSPLEAAAPEVLAAPAGPPASADEGTSVTERWWFWTALGVVVVGATVGIVVASTSNSNPNTGTTGITLQSQ
ncbi:MAG TPA: tetratricopeptide repeat protein [Polyangiales bacterium]|nr:tetratricopeptide repeat protein [Polyangiales bacterium]